MAAEVDIPIVDFSVMSVEHKDPLKENFEAVKIVADEVYQAFSTIGFVFLKNHGIPQETVDVVFKTYDEFFNLSSEVKAKYAKTKGTLTNGWDAVEKESTNPERPGDLKESFDVECLDENLIWPNQEVPHFQSTVVSFYQMVADLALRILTVVAVGLKLEPSTFTRRFSKMGTSKGAVQLRYNYYPRIEDFGRVKPGQIRCGEHTDYGAITVLFQDENEGLEVKNKNGEFVAARPIKGTVLVNIADLLQRWTADKLKSTVHRVLIPESESKRRIPRRSLVLFADPDLEETIECVDGSSKYPPITSGEWKRRRLLATYNYEN